MRVLGIDTATATASVALVEDGKLIAEEIHRCNSQPRSSSSGASRPNHAEILLPLVDRLSKKTGIHLRDLAALAISIGPGSFTGLRIGLSTVKGLAYGCGIPVVGVPTLGAVAARVTDWDGLICPFLDARKKEVYAALFRKKGESLERLADDAVCAPERVIGHIQSRREGKPCLFIGAGVRVYGSLIQDLLGEGAILAVEERYPSVASAVARLGEEKLARVGGDPVGPLVPLYLRPSEAELKRRG